MVRDYNKVSWTFLVLWFCVGLFCIGLNVAFMYMLWKLGWAAIAFLSSH